MAPSWIGAALVVVLALMAITMPERGHRVVRHLVTTSGTLLLLGLFLVGRRMAARATVRPIIWWGWGVAALGVSLAVPAFHSSDLHAYTQVGWVQTHYDANPYTTRAVDLPESDADPMFTDTWRETPCVYGPLFAWMAQGPAALSGGDPHTARVAFRVLHALCVLLIAWLLWCSAPTARARVRAIYPWLWSPFVLLHLGANGHNDAMFGLLLLLAMVAARRGAGLWVLPLLVLAVLFKIVAVVALPFALLWTVRRCGAQVALGACALAAGFAAWAVLPYLASPNAIRYAEIWAEWSRPTHSLTAAMHDGLRALESLWGGTGVTASAGTDALRGALLGAYFAWLCVTFVRAWRVPNYGAGRLLVHTVAALGLLLVLVSAKFYPWYLCMVLPSALLLPAAHPLRRAAVLLSCTWMLAFTGLGKARIVDALVMTVIPLAWFIASERARVRASAGPTSVPT